jgi:hypothetical protein
MSITMYHSPSIRASLFLLVRNHSQMQYYLKLADTRRAANDGGLVPAAVRRLANVVDIGRVRRRLPGW